MSCANSRAERVSWHLRSVNERKRVVNECKQRIRTLRGWRVSVSRAERARFRLSCEAPRLIPRGRNAD